MYHINSQYLKNETFWKHHFSILWYYNFWHIGANHKCLNKETSEPSILIRHPGFCYYRVYPSNKQKQNWKIDTSLVAIGAQNLFFSLYKLGVNFLWIREILKMYISPSFSNRKKVQYYRFCIFKGVSKLDLLHSTGHKSLKNGSKSNNLGSLIKFRKFLAR